MNINSSSVPSLLSGNSLESMQNTLQADGTVSEAFSETLMEKIKQLESLSGDYSSDKKMPENVGIFHDLAGIDDLFGNNLPQDSGVFEGFDLQETLQALEKMLSDLDKGELPVDMETMLKQIERLQENLPESSKLNESLEKIANDLEKMQGLLLNEQDGSIESQIASLETEIDSIIESMANKTSESKEIRNELQEINNEENETELLASQLNSLNTITNSSLEKERNKLSPRVLEGLKQGIKKESISLQQKIDENSLVSSPVKKEPESLLQQQNTFQKIEQETLLLASKASEKSAVLNMDNLDMPEDKTALKFSIDIANLNRAVMTENKAEIPPMSKHFAHPEWNKEIGERVLWMHKQAVPSAELRLNPAHLGPVSIKIDVTQDQATVAFTAQHLAVKEAIEAALPKLKEMFSAQQLNLVDVNVSQQDSGQRQQKSFAETGNGMDKGDETRNGENSENEHAEKVADITEEIAAGRAIASNGVLSLFV